MAKKKSKIASNRGFATVSTPSKKPEATATKPANESIKDDKSVPAAATALNDKVPSKEAIAPPTHDQQDNMSTKGELETADDAILRLVKKYESLNDYKAQATFDRLNKEDPQIQQLPEERIKKFRLSADVEKELLRVVNSKSSNHWKNGTASALMFNSNSTSHQAKEKLLGQLDVLYRTLLKLGFDDQDVSASFEATVSDTLEDHLNWLCINVPYERMPVGFFDKYFNEEDDDQLILLHNASNGNNHATASMVESTEVTENITASNNGNKVQESLESELAVKARILQAAEQYMNEDEEEDVNQKYANIKMQLSELQKQLPNHTSGKKGKKSKKKAPFESDDTQSKVLSDADLAKVQKDIKSLRDKLASLEADWDYDEAKATALYNQQVQEQTERLRQKQMEARALLKKQKAEQDEKEELKKEYEIVGPDSLDIEQSDDEEDGLFGGLMMGEEEEEAALLSKPEQSSTSIEWNIINLELPKTFISRQPKDLLQDYCNKYKLGKQSYTTNNKGSGIWQSTLNIRKDNYSAEPISYKLPDNMAATTKQGAEQLIAIYALFKLDPGSSTYKVLPPCYRDVWETWAEEKKLAEEAPRIEADKRRFALLTQIVEKTCCLKEDNIDKKGTVSDTNTPDDGLNVQQPNATAQSEQLFAKVRNNFKKRLDKKEYLSMKQKRQTLPIYAHREEILDIMRKNQVLIISGETGCGKSTQVPQFLAEDLLIEAKKPGSVICTQPRRISAMSIANRVSIEMGDRPRTTGSREAMVGYQIRLESKMSAENVLLFCTTGILLRRLESDKFLKGVSYVIVDEVHERTIESDFLLVVLKRLLEARSDLKVILMSATVEASRFSAYFGGCPVISVPGRTYPVHVQFLEDVIEETGYVLEEDSPFALRRKRIKTVEGDVYVTGGHGTSKKVHYDMFEEDSDDDPYDPTRLESKLTVDAGTVDNEKEEAIMAKYSRRTRKIIKRMDDKRINYDLILQLLDHICHRKDMVSNSDGAKVGEEKVQTTADSISSNKAAPNNDKPAAETKIPDKGAILVFLPGINEIRRLYDLVSSHHEFGNPKKYSLIALHSTLSSENQEKAFEVPPEGIRKIVFSTNIAETGVTISDVTVVIDTGMARVVSYDEKKRVSRLLQKYVAKANARQRRGRAGRVQEGICFHLFTQERFETMAEYEAPEILRLPLEELCLRIKVCKLGSIRDVLGAALDAPSERMINNAILTLQEVQALSTDGKETLTPLGAHLANLPVDVHIGKMILFGAIFRCLDPVLTVAAALSFKSPFVRPFGREDEADAARARFQAYNSDFLTIYKAYTIWRDYIYQLQEDNVSKASLQKKLKRFCNENFLSEQNLEMIEDMKRQYLGLLVSIGFVKLENGRLGDNPYDIKRSRIQICRVPDQYNIYSQSVPVINAALTAGLYPKMAEYLRQSKQFINKSLELQIHPSSVLFHKEHTLMSNFLVYNTVVMNKTGNAVKDKIFMWETASVDAIAIILLSTDLDIKHKQRKIVLDEWIYFDCFARTAVLLKFLREELNNLLAEKMNKPDLDFTKCNEEVMYALVQALESGSC